MRKQPPHLHGRVISLFPVSYSYLRPLPYSLYPARVPSLLVPKCSLLWHLPSTHLRCDGLCRGLTIEGQGTVFSLLRHTGCCFLLVWNYLYWQSFYIALDELKRNQITQEICFCYTKVTIYDFLKHISEVLKINKKTRGLLQYSRSITSYLGVCTASCGNQCEILLWGHVFWQPQVYKCTFQITST